MIKTSQIGWFLFLWYNIFMEKMPSNHENNAARLGRVSRLFGNIAVWRVEKGASKVTLNPVLGVGVYHDDAILEYTQAKLGDKGFATHVERDMIESGSEVMMPRDRLIVDSRPEK